MNSKRLITFLVIAISFMGLQNLINDVSHRMNFEFSSIQKQPTQGEILSTDTKTCNMPEFNQVLVRNTCTEKIKDEILTIGENLLFKVIR